MGVMGRFLATACFVVALSVVAFATEGKYIGNVMSAGAAEHYTIVVETVPKKLYLLKINGDNQTIIDSADILTGREGY